MVLLWVLLGIAALGIALVVVGRARARAHLPFVRHHQNPPEKVQPRIPEVGEIRGDGGLGSAGLG
jgi:hypothetical protein